MAKQDHYAGLDLLRIAAAYLVLLNHLGQFNRHYDVQAHGTVKHSPLAFPFMEPFSGVGSVGVEIFFVISGFVITASVRDSTPMQFLRRRFVRVMPALWICATVALLARASVGESLPYLLACWVRTVTLFPLGPTIDGVVWTLVVEAFFYGLVFFALLLARAPLYLLAKIIGFSSVAYLAVLTLVHLNAAHPAAAHLDALLDRFPFKLFLLRHGVFFAAGMLFWRWIEEGRPPSRLPLLILFLAFGALEILATNERAAAGALVTLAIWLGGMAWLFYSVCYNRQVNDRLAPWRALVAQLGRLSYTLYLSHYAFGMVVVSVLLSLHFDIATAFVLTILIVSAVAWIIMIDAERRAQNGLKTLLADLGAFLSRNRRKPPVGEVS